MWRLSTRLLSIPLFAAALLWLLWFACTEVTALGRVPAPGTSLHQDQPAAHVPTVAIILTKTVGIDPDDCATTKVITVSANTPHYYCYTVQNIGSITLTTHTIKDSLSATPLKDQSFYLLKPGAPPDSVTFITATVSTLQQTTVSTGTWIAATADGITVTAHDSTKVLVPELRVTETVGTYPRKCATTKQIDVMPGTKVTYCSTVYNSGKVTLRLHSAQDSNRSLQKDNLPLVLTPNATSHLTVTTPITQTTTNVITWTGYVTDTHSPFAIATDSAEVHTPAISLQVTVGTDPTACATATAITVTSGTEVNYCYMVTNTGGVTLTRHEIDDSLSVAPFARLRPLPPQATYPIGPTVVVTQTGSNKVTWIAYGAGALSATSSNQATVTVVYTLGVFLFYDVDSNKHMNDLERGWPGAVLHLIQPTGILTATTDVTGNAIFTNVREGKYTIVVDETSLPAGFMPTTGNNVYNGEIQASQANLLIGYTSAPDYNSDCDAIPDRLEGPGDLNQNGIPNYLDANCLYLPIANR